MRDNKDLKNVHIVLHSSETTHFISLSMRCSYNRGSLSVPRLKGMYLGAVPSQVLKLGPRSHQSAVKWTVTVSNLGGGSCEEGRE